MNNVLNWLNGLLMPILPADIYSRLDLLYNGSIILLGAGVVLLLAAMVLMNSRYIGAYLSYLLVVALFTGFATGAACAGVLRALKAANISI